MYDAVIIGAGVVGCAVARELSRYTTKNGCFRKRRGRMLWYFQGKQRYCSCGI